MQKRTYATAFAVDASNNVDEHHDHQQQQQQRQLTIEQQHHARCSWLQLAQHVVDGEQNSNTNQVTAQHASPAARLFAACRNTACEHQQHIDMSLVLQVVRGTHMQVLRRATSLYSRCDIHHRRFMPLAPARVPVQLRGRDRRRSAVSSATLPQQQGNNNNNNNNPTTIQNATTRIHKHVALPHDDSMRVAFQDADGLLHRKAAVIHVTTETCVHPQEHANTPVMTHDLQRVKTELRVVPSLTSLPHNIQEMGASSSSSSSSASNERLMCMLRPNNCYVNNVLCNIVLSQMRLAGITPNTIAMFDCMQDPATGGMVMVQERMGWSMSDQSRPVVELLSDSNERRMWNEQCKWATSLEDMPSLIDLVHSRRVAQLSQPASRIVTSASLIDSALLQLVALLALLQHRLGFVQHDMVCRNILARLIAEDDIPFRNRPLHSYTRWVFVVDEHDLETTTSTTTTTTTTTKRRRRVFADPQPQVVFRLSDFELACLYYVRAAENNEPQCDTNMQHLAGIVPTFLNHPDLQSRGIHDCFSQSEQCYDMHSLLLNLREVAHAQNCYHLTHLASIWELIWTTPCQRQPRTRNAINPLRPRDMLFLDNVFAAWEIDESSIDHEHDLVLYI